MPHELYKWLGRIKSVELEYSATRLATDRLLAAVRLDPTVLRGDVTVRDVEHAAERLDGTYTIRIFAEFETGLRLFRATARAADSPIRTRDLLESVAAMCLIPNDRLAEAQVAREYRNSLVHQREDVVQPIALHETRRRLCRFFSFLPQRW